MPLRWTEGDHTHQGFRGFRPSEKPPDGEGFFVATATRYSGDTWRVDFNRYGASDQPIRCWFPSGEAAMAAADEWFDTHPEMQDRPKPERRDDWY